MNVYVLPQLRIRSWRTLSEIPEKLKEALQAAGDSETVGSTEQ